jgi:ERO1-like protein alpha
MSSASLVTLMCLLSLASAAAVPILPQWTPLPVTGEVGDAKCNVEEVESANEQQLHEILRELTNTTYFRLFQVDLSRKCKFWNKPPQVRHDATRRETPPLLGAVSTSLPHSQKKVQHPTIPPPQFSPPHRSAAILPISFAQEEEAEEEPSCSAPSIGGNGGAGFLGGGGFGGGGSSGFGGGGFSSTSGVGGAAAAAAAAAATEAAPTMCSLDLASKDPGEMKWAPPSTPVDRTISRQEDRAISVTSGDGSDCADEDLPTFWMDMCPNPSDAEDKTEHVNLQLNPERWTGYNGSHVWSAIYEENCLRAAASFDDMCYEERVLYRLLSGMHASVNIHIALKAKPPKRGVPGREDWSADPKRFMDHYGSHPERLRNLHFSFVVLLRALRKAAPALASMDVRLGQDGAEDAKVEALMRRLLDTHILSSCSGVFGAFDESLLFKAAAAERAAKEAAGGGVGGSTPGGGSGGGGGGGVPVASLKSQFKGVFHNISEVMDCISCQKCKLHGKLQLLGLGTALKVRLGWAVSKLNPPSQVVSRRLLVSDSSLVNLFLRREKKEIKSKS